MGENSDVSPTACAAPSVEVAVAEMSCPAVSVAVVPKLKVALPLPSVKTLVEPIKVRHSLPAPSVDVLL